MNKRIWVVGGSIGAGILLMLMSFNSVAASNANKQSINEKNNIDRFALNLKILNNFLQKQIPSILLSNPFERLLAALFSIFLYVFFWIYSNIWLNLGK